MARPAPRLILRTSAHPHPRRRRVPHLSAALAGLLLALAAASPVPLAAQERTWEETRALVAHRHALEDSLQAVAHVERKRMLPMRDGVRLQTDVYWPKDAPEGGVPVIFSRTPYNFNWWDTELGAPRDMSRVLEWVKRGYAYVQQNERGHYFSEGNWDILGPPLTDGEDAIEWLASREWSNGKVGLIGCSSTAEWQMAVASRAPEGLAAMNPAGFGAGVGRVGDWYEQGNWYRGGAVQMLFIAWISSQQNQVRPMFPPGATQEELVMASKAFDLHQELPWVDWSEALRHLPVEDILVAAGRPHGVFADSMPVATGGRMIQRTPDDEAWYRGGLYHDDMPFDVPTLWYMTWYDVSIGPNLAMFNHARTAASPEVADMQYAVIAPTLHCRHARADENTVVGDRSVGDPRRDFDGLTTGFFDHVLKGRDTALLDTLPHVTYFTMGMGEGGGEWQTSETWPPTGAVTETWYLTSGGDAGTTLDDGRLVRERPAEVGSDAYTYDPMDPVPSYGGNVCCTGNAVEGGSFDQTELEAEREDILVYSSPVLEEGVEVSGPVTVTLYVSSDARDTDFTAKLIDVDGEGRAWNLDETIQRVRYREGYDREVWMEEGGVYEVTLGPLNTSNWFAPGHRIRIEISSSNFPRFDRNLNTGGRNYDESEGVAARNVVWFGGERASRVALTVVPSGG